MDLKQKIFNSPMTGFQWLVVALAVMLNMLDGFDVLAIAFTAKSIKSELGLTGAQIGSLISAGTVGMMAGSFTLGPLADKLGRRPVLILSTVLSAIGMLMTYFSHSVAAIAFSRVITGIGVGGILPCTNVIVSEYANKKWRGLAIAIYASGFGIGATLGGISAVSLQAQYGWRAVFLVGAGLTMFAFVALLTLLPESVEFLLNKQPENAKARLDKIAAKIGIADDWTFSVQAATKQQKVSFLRLFEKDNIRTTLLIWLAFVAVTSSYYFISSWTPALLEEAGMQNPKPNRGHGDCDWRCSRFVVVRFLGEPLGRASCVVGVYRVVCRFRLRVCGNDFHHIEFGVGAGNCVGRVGKWLYHRSIHHQPDFV